MVKKIADTPEAWETGELGRDEKFAKVSDQEDWEVDEELGMKMISIRLPSSLIEDFKMIAALNGIGYQPLMRKMLGRFAEAEKKKILTEAYNAMKKLEKENAEAKKAKDAA